MCEKTNCAHCKEVIPTWELQWVSSLYGSNHTLCEACGQAEERMIEGAGTNDLPLLLKSYGFPNEGN